MLFWKRLHRSRDSTTTTGASFQERRFFGILRSAKRKDVSTPLPAYRQETGSPASSPEDGLPLGLEGSRTVEPQAQENDYVLEESVRRGLLIPPPPQYPPYPSLLPLTPPPSYTERPRQGVVEVVARPVPLPVHPSAAELEARQQARRRRRLRDLQQQQQQLRFASSTDSSSSSGSSSSESSSGGSGHRRRQRRRRGLRDAYCPDLLHACSLILQQPNGSSSSSVGNFTATPPPPAPLEPESVEYSSDYVEIDELLPLVAAGRAKSTPQLAMGQNLSLRRPRISLTWVLREQQQQQTQQQAQTPASPATPQKEPSTDAVEKQPAEKLLLPARTEPVPTQLDVSKKRYRVKQLPGGGEPLNGYATTPTAHQAPPNGHLTNQKFFSNQNLLDVSRNGPSAGAPVATAASTKELLFVCTPQRAPRSDGHSEALLLARKRNEIRKKLASRLQQARSQASETRGSVTGAESLKCTSYSEPSLVAASEGGGGATSGGGTTGAAQQPQQQRRHRHRKRRDRNRVQRFGYEIHNVDEFLSRCSLATPGNIPVVLATASTLYQTRPGGYQLEIPLPLGMVVNAVFKNQNWLYVQTPHAEEGYVGYACCLPLGILPQQARNGSSRNTPCWETNADVFPRPCGNMTDSEKEIRLRGGTRSDGARTPRSTKPAQDDLLKISSTTINNNNNQHHSNNNNKSGSTASSLYGEQQVDKLYLRAASKPRLVEKAYAQLRSTRNVTSGSVSARSAASQDEYVTLQQKSATKQSHSNSKAPPVSHLHQSQPTRRLSNVSSYITNGQNGQHLHPHPHQHPQTVPLPPYKPAKSQAESLRLLRQQQQDEVGQRQTLVAISTDYITESIAVHKGEIVTLCDCRESKDQRQWFYVRTRDGREGFIPAEVAGHGYL
ncbi:uncharacterized protein [Drosophila bipectinata]|uniref:uncharacterized protein isoform X1 n=1 Tax=Drosophila bipectinata TaxID=42026 RepID=UPI001C8A993F|nr:uncharacterized protein LOC108120830 isoform X1 [Drosophila bipectinata]